MSVHYESIHTHTGVEPLSTQWSESLEYHDINYYVNRLRNWEYFAVAGYSDAEWFSILKKRIGNTTGLGQVLHLESGVKLQQIMKRREKDPNFIFAMPKCLWEPAFDAYTPIIDRVLALTPSITIHERDRVTDDLAASAGLHPFIKQLQGMRTVVIGNQHLRGLDFLDYDQFIEISSPNCHLEPDSIDKVVSQIDPSKPATYLVSAGISAALIIDAIYDIAPRSFFIDCGSIWDAFVGIGGQREWRRKLYDDLISLTIWKADNLYGKS